VYYIDIDIDRRACGHSVIQPAKVGNTDDTCPTLALPEWQQAEEQKSLSYHTDRC
jgi:hypothetical protein